MEGIQRAGEIANVPSWSCMVHAGHLGRDEGAVPVQVKVVYARESVSGRVGERVSG